MDNFKTCLSCSFFSYSSNNSVHIARCVFSEIQIIAGNVNKMRKSTSDGACEDAHALTTQTLDTNARLFE